MRVVFGDGFAVDATGVADAFRDECDGFNDYIGTDRCSIGFAIIDVVFGDVRKISFTSYFLFVFSEKLDFLTTGKKIEHGEIHSSESID